MRVELEGTLGLLAPDPRQRAFGSLDSHSGGDQARSEARLAEGEPGLQGSRLATGEARRGACGVLPIRHGFRRDTFPDGEGFLGCVSSGGAPLRSPRFA